MFTSHTSGQFRKRNYIWCFCAHAAWDFRSQQYPKHRTVVWGPIKIVWLDVWCLEHRAIHSTISALLVTNVFWGVLRDRNDLSYFSNGISKYTTPLLYHHHHQNTLKPCPRFDHFGWRTRGLSQGGTLAERVPLATLGGPLVKTQRKSRNDCECVRGWL